MVTVLSHEGPWRDPRRSEKKIRPKKNSSRNGRNWQEIWSIRFFGTIILNRSLNHLFENPSRVMTTICRLCRFTAPAQLCPLNLMLHRTTPMKSSINTGAVGKSSIFDVRLFQEWLNPHCPWGDPLSKTQIVLHHSLFPPPTLRLQTLREAPI